MIPSFSLQALAQAETLDFFNCILTLLSIPYSLDSRLLLAAVFWLLQLDFLVFVNGRQTCELCVGGREISLIAGKGSVKTLANCVSSRPSIQERQCGKEHLRSYCPRALPKFCLYDSAARWSACV
jgi:hypothetical protein